MQNARERLEALLAERIAVLDGSWGVLLQNRGLTEEEWRGERFREHPRDVKGDPDLLNLTRPEIVESVHRAYFEAGADIATTNTFTATSIGQADYALEAAVRDMNVEGARLARKVADEHDGFVAGSVGPLNVTLSLSPKVEDPAFRAVRFEDVVASYTEQMRGAARRRRRPAPDRDDLRHAQCEGRCRGRSRGRARASALDLVHGDRPQRAQPLRADGRGLLDLDRARPSADRRGQLLGRRARDAAGDRVALARSHDVRLLPSECGPAERARRLRRAARRDQHAPGRLRAGGLRQRGRRLLRHDAGAHRRDRRGRPRAPAAGDPRAPAATALQRPRAVRDRGGHRLRHDRRAHERHRLHALPQPGRGERLRLGGRGRARAGPRRREPARRQHGRRPAGRGRGDDDLPAAGRIGARGRPDPDRRRQLALRGARGRPRVRAGQGRRELDLAQGGRGAVPRAGRTRGRARRRGDRDGLRRAGAGRHGRAQGRDLRARLQAARRPGRLRARGHRLRPERARGRDGDRGAQRLREGLHRRAPADQGALPRRAHLRRDLEPLLRVSRQRPRPRGDARRLPLPRDPRRARHGDRQRRAADGLRGHRAGAARARRGRALRPAAGRDRAAGRVREPRQGRGDEARGRPLLARGAGRQAPLVRARPRGGRLHRRGHRGGAAAARAAARRDRGPADGRHGDRRRPLREREDVPAAGREERSRDEARGRLPRAVHGGGEGAHRHLARAGEARACDRQGRRARHRQEHRRRRARLQQL